MPDSLRQRPGQARHRRAWHVISGLDGAESSVVSGASAADDEGFAGGFDDFAGDGAEFVDFHDAGDLGGEPVQLMTYGLESTVSSPG